jgi:hypothetical protein
MKDNSTGMPEEAEVIANSMAVMHDWSIGSMAWGAAKKTAEYMLQARADLPAASVETRPTTLDYLEGKASMVSEEFYPAASVQAGDVREAVETVRIGMKLYAFPKHIHPALETLIAAASRQPEVVTAEYVYQRLIGRGFVNTGPILKELSELFPNGIRIVSKKEGAE